MFLSNFWDILLPRFCLGCGREGQYICKDCEVFLSEVENTMPGLISIWEYEGLMEKLIWEIKYHGKYHIVEELVEKALEKVELKLPADTYITYVPMHKKKEKERGFNQAELMARMVGRRTGREVLPLLKKTKDNKSQVGLSPKERIENVKGVFELRKQNFSKSFPPNHALLRSAEPHDLKNLFSSPQNVLLVDDVYTTGATARECVRVLRRAGVKKVWVFTLAKKLSI